MSAIGDTYSHPVTTVKHRSPDVSITTTTTTRQAPYQTEALNKTFLEATIEAYSTKLFPSTFYRIEEKKKKTCSKHANADANQGMFLQTACPKRARSGENVPPFS